MRTLITGFGPFLGIVDNPSERLARHFAAHGAPGHDITIRVLPVSYAQTAAILPELLTSNRFDAALLLGVDSGGHDRLRLERFGHNRTRAGSPDVDGFAPGDNVIAPGAPETCESPVDVESLQTCLAAAGLACRVSHDAGGYVCNHAYYTALRAAAMASPPTPCLFLHVPPDTRAFPLEAQRRAVEVVLAWLTASVPAGTP